MIDELNQYHLVTNNIKVLKKQREEFICLSFGAQFSTQALRGRLLAGEVGISSLQNTFTQLSQASESSTTFDPYLVEGCFGFLN